MTTRERLIQEIRSAPEELLPLILDYLRTNLKQNGRESSIAKPEQRGPYAEYWDQFIGQFSAEEWERPDQGALELREEW